MKFAKRLFASSYCLMIAVCIAATSGVVLAQSSAPDAQRVVQAGNAKAWRTCQDNYMDEGAWAQCRLTLKDNELRQGDDQRVVAVSMPMRPLKLRRFVAGDSASYYAGIHDRKELWFNGLVMTGSALLSVGLVSSTMCLQRVCKHTSATTLARDGMYTGGGLLLISIPFRLSGRKAGHLAIDFWNNSLGKGKP